MLRGPLSNESEVTNQLRPQSSDNTSPINKHLIDVMMHTTQEWQDREGYVPPEDSMAIYTDYRVTSGGIDIPGIKIGDGAMPIEDLPFITDWEDEKIEELEDYVKGLFLGETTTALYDGYASPSIVIDGEVVVAKNGNIVVYNRREFIWDESNGKWVELGIAVFVPGTGNNSAQQAGTGAVASGASSVAEGYQTTASGDVSHAEGAYTLASGRGSHAEGVEYNEIATSAEADAAHAEGAGVVVKGQAAHGEGLLNVAGRTQEAAVTALADFPNLSGTTEQKVSKLIGFASHSEGSSTQALGTSSHAEGNSTQALVNATHAEGDTTTASGEAAHSEGYITTASGNQSHSEGFNTQATANQAHSEGKKTIASAENAHSEGNETKAVGNASHSEGYRTCAYGVMSHIEGTSSTLVSDTNAASESVESIWKENGHNFSLSRGQGSHVEGKNCLATGDWSHAEGVSCSATKIGSHAEGRGTQTGEEVVHVEGTYNVGLPNCIHEVGIGTSYTRKNAHTITTDGKHYIPGVGGYVGTETTLPSGQDLATIINSKVEGTFIAMEGSTSFADVNAAIYAGREVICLTPAGYAYLTQKASNYITFEALPSSSYNGASRKATIDNNNNWTPSYVCFELVYDTTNKKLKKTYDNSTYVDVVTAVKIVEDGAATANLISQSDFDAIFN